MKRVGLLEALPRLQGGMLEGSRGKRQTEEQNQSCIWGDLSGFSLQRGWGLDGNGSIGLEEAGWQRGPRCWQGRETRRLRLYFGNTKCTGLGDLTT